VHKVNAASVPRSERILGRADCLATDALGDVVRIRAAKVANRFQVEKVDISTVGSPPAVAVVVRKYTATDCIVQFHGPLRAIYGALTPGRAYLVGTDSTPATVGDANYPVAGSDYFQQMGVSTSTDELLILFLDATFGGVAAGVRFFQQALIPTGNPSVFTTALPFKHGGIDTEAVHYNGHRQFEGVSGVGDYSASESGGVGTGYDTVTFHSVPNTSHTNIFLIDYTPDV
jgi:hypothetical protein